MDPFPRIFVVLILPQLRNAHAGKLDATPLHYATECILTSSSDMTNATSQLEPVWFHSVTTRKGSRLEIQKMVCHLEENQDLFSINNHTFQ
ncbi:hypothetical protein AVEN_130350-1 [Araneus ventricosus]|uniref:Uncharacterized protein n=1 Tax=Araneus ventricosus TaxID=182803 RepID=A0A4Y2BEQ4_ARAVE|nr:hypothetical protein AVEN_130350-1 [Araneus ventricosus]